MSPTLGDTQKELLAKHVESGWQSTAEIALSYGITTAQPVQYRSLIRSLDALVRRGHIQKEHHLDNGVARSMWRTVPEPLWLNVPMSEAAAESTRKPVKRVAKAPPQTLPRLDLVKPAAKVVEGKFYEPVYLHRFLFENGDVVDVLAIRDDSRLREALLAQRNIHGDRITGSTQLDFVGYPDMESLIKL